MFFARITGKSGGSAVFWSPWLLLEEEAGKVQLMAMSSFSRLCLYAVRLLSTLEFEYGTRN